jgi:hypothetical protein
MQVQTIFNHSSSSWGIQLYADILLFYHWLIILNYYLYFLAYLYLRLIFIWFIFINPQKSKSATKLTIIFNKVHTYHYKVEKYNLHRYICIYYLLCKLLHTS